MLRFANPKTARPARLAGRLALLAGVLAAGWAVAPAISAEPYIPVAEDFEQAVPSLERLDAPAPARAAGGDSEHAGDDPVTHLSPVIEAPARFDLAGVARETRPLELRGRERGGEWTSWTVTANGDPVWFGGMDELQLRARGWRPSGQIHYVNVSGDATPADGALTGARQAVNGVVSAGMDVLGSDAAIAGSTRPAVVSRREWGANRSHNGCKPRRRADRGKVKAAVVHHTVSAVNYSRADAPGLVLGICRYHRNGNGWDDIGYNALVDRFGRIYAGRAGGLGRAIVGAHTQGYNAQTTGVAVLGTHTSTPISRLAKRGVARWLAWKLPKHGLTTKGRARLISAGGSANRYPAGTRVRTKRIMGHRRTGYTECPGDALQRQLSQITRNVQRRIDG